MNDWYSDGVGACSEPTEKASWPFMEGGHDTMRVSLRHADGVFAGQFFSYPFLTFRPDSQSVQRNSPLGKEKAPCSEPFGSLMGSRYDQRGGGPDEPTNNGTEDSCHRSHVGALRGEQLSFIGGREFDPAGSELESGQGAAGAPKGLIRG